MGWVADNNMSKKFCESGKIIFKILQLPAVPKKHAKNTQVRFRIYICGISNVYCLYGLENLKKHYIISIIYFEF